MKNNTNNTKPLKPTKKRAPGAGLKKGQTNNPNGRPVGALNKASTSVKQIIANFYLEEKDESKPELANILEQLRINTSNDLSLGFKISMGLKYLRFISSFARDEGEVETEKTLTNLFMEKFFGDKQT